jgi:hypothetical protein
VSDSTTGAPERQETEPERLDRNTVELLNELRVLGTGIQVLFGFLLVVPFNARFGRLSSFERGIYVTTLCCIATSTVLLIAPSIHHRILFRRGEKEFLVDTGTRLVIVASVFLALGLTGIMLLLGSFVLGTLGAVLLAIAAATLTGVIWFAIPIRRRLNEQRGPR